MKIEANKFYWTRNKEIVYICEVEHNSYSYCVVGYSVYPSSVKVLTWTLDGRYNYAYPEHPRDLIKEMTDPVLKAFYDDCK